MSRTLLLCFAGLTVGFGTSTANAQWVWATEVVEHSTETLGHLPEKVFGPPNCSATCSGGESVTCSFTVDGEPGSGVPGYMVVGFGTRFYDVPGNDIEVHLFDLNSDEQFKVYACESPGDCVFVCRVDPLDPGVGCTCGLCSNACDLADAGIPSARYVMIENDREDPGTLTEGPEVDAVRVSVADPVPTVSEWGLVVMALLVLTAGTLVYARRRPIHW